MKDPVSVFGGWRGFSFRGWQALPAKSTPNQHEGTNCGPGNLFPKEVQRCPHGWKFC